MRYTFLNLLLKYDTVFCGGIQDSRTNVFWGRGTDPKKREVYIMYTPLVFPYSPLEEPKALKQNPLHPARSGSRNYLYILALNPFLPISLHPCNVAVDQMP